MGNMASRGLWGKGTMCVHVCEGRVDCVSVRASCWEFPRWGLHPLLCTPQVFLCPSLSPSPSIPFVVGGGGGDREEGREVPGHAAPFLRQESGGHSLGPHEASGRWILAFKTTGMFNHLQRHTHSHARNPGCNSPSCRAAPYRTHALAAPSSRADTGWE